MPLPGYRTGKLWKRIIASLYYGWMAAIFVEGMILSWQGVNLMHWAVMTFFFGGFGIMIFYFMKELAWQIRDSEQKK